MKNLLIAALVIALLFGIFATNPPMLGIHVKADMCGNGADLKCYVRQGTRNAALMQAQYRYSNPQPAAGTTNKIPGWFLVAVGVLAVVGIEKAIMKRR